MSRGFRNLDAALVALLGPPADGGTPLPVGVPARGQGIDDSTAELLEELLEDHLVARLLEECSCRP